MAVAGSEPSLHDTTLPEQSATRGGTARLFIKLLLPDVLFTTGEGAVVGLLTIFLAERFFLQPGPLGVLLTGAGLAGGATSLLAPRLVRRWGRLKLATGMQFASIPAILGIGFLPILPLVALAEFARQICAEVFEPVYLTFAMERVSARSRGTLSGFYSLTWSWASASGRLLPGSCRRTWGSRRHS